jgi:hypothetical protein
VNVGLFSRKHELAAEKRVSAHYRSLWLQSLDARTQAASKHWDTSRDVMVLQAKLTQEKIKNGKLRKAIHDAVDVMEKVAPVEEGK